MSWILCLIHNKHYTCVNKIQSLPSEFIFMKEGKGVEMNGTNSIYLKCKVEFESKSECRGVWGNLIWLVSSEKT